MNDPVSDADGPRAIMDRRRFLQTTAAAAAAATAVTALGQETGGKVDVWVFHGPDPGKLMDACLRVIRKEGGLGPRARRLALKVNAAWARTPEQGANTHPDLVDRFLAGCSAFGVREVVLPEHSVAPAVRSFAMSGILKVARRHGAKMVDLKKQRDHFETITIPNGKRLKKTQVAREFLKADVVVNMPVAKHHGGAGLTIAMKNWMGAVLDRRYWHRNDLHECIADFSSFMKPAWTIVDATRIMMDHGPQGPARRLERKNTIILSRDQVAADAVAATLFGKLARRARYIAIAGQRGIGVADLSRMNIHRIEVPA